jgi:3-hydroxyisobutyrate dehydrogenase
MGIISPGRLCPDAAPDATRQGNAHSALDMKVGFIGLGDQGAPMARAIGEHHFVLHVWGRRESTVASFLSSGATRHAIPASLAAAVDLLSLCVVSGADVEELLFARGVLAAMRPGSILVVHTTMDPEACRQMASQAGERGVGFLDAPVSGGGAAAARRELLVLVGGEASLVERARPVLGTYGNPITHLGGVGAGQTCKILNNLLLNTNLAAAQFALSLGAALGFERPRIRDAILRGTGRSYALEALDETLIPGQLSETLGRKDTLLARALAEACTLQLRERVDLMAQLALLGRSDLSSTSEKL